MTEPSTELVSRLISQHPAPAPLAPMTAMCGLSQETARGMIEFCLECDPAPRRWHITRVFMYRKLENLLAAYDSSDARGLSISRSLPLAHVLGFTKASITEINFPEYDLARLPFDSNTFDFCVSDFVLEHLADPHSAVAESFRVVKPGGHVIITTAFMCELHYDPIDLWRFSPMALRLMCERYSDELQIGFWGNREAWSFIDAGYRFRKIPENPNNPLFQLAMRNEETYALTTWVVAKVK